MKCPLFYTFSLFADIPQVRKSMGHGLQRSSIS